MKGLGLRVKGLGLRVKCLGLRGKGLGLRGKDPGSSVQGSRLTISSGLRLRVQGVKL